MGSALREASTGCLKEGLEIIGEEFPADEVALVINGGSDDASDVYERSLAELALSCATGRDPTPRRELEVSVGFALMKIGVDLDELPDVADPQVRG